MKEISKTVEKKVGNTWTETFRTTDPADVWESLAGDLIAKKLNGCAWIKRVVRENLFNGYQRITLTQDNGIRVIYVVNN